MRIYNGKSWGDDELHIPLELKELCTSSYQAACVWYCFGQKQADQIQRVQVIQAKNQNENLKMSLKEWNGMKQIT